MRISPFLGMHEFELFEYDYSVIDNANSRYSVGVERMN